VFNASPLPLYPRKRTGTNCKRGHVRLRKKERKKERKNERKKERKEGRKRINLKRSLRNRMSVLDGCK
jgi:hypothetical protein